MKRIILFSILIFSFTSFAVSQERIEEEPTGIEKDSLSSCCDSCKCREEIEKILKQYFRIDSVKPGYKDIPNPLYPPVHPKRMVPEYRREFSPRLIYCLL